MYIDIIGLPEMEDDLEVKKGIAYFVVEFI